MNNISIMTQESANHTYLYAAVFVDELQRTNLRNVVICPGSRSTPLAMAFAAQTAIQTWMHVDERSAAFFGLGMAKRLHEPVALLCTSGTAAANFLPALVEATLSHAPLLVLTADRPHELRENGAPQSIDQNRLYGTYAKWFVDVALPEATNAAFRYVRTIADRAVAATQTIPAGPVHLNFPFREPLTPEPIPELPLPPVEQRDLVAWEGRPDNAPYTGVFNTSHAIPDSAAIGNIQREIFNALRGLIIVGPNDDSTLIEPLVRLAAYLGYPILADPLSQLRTGNHSQTQILTSYDAFLRIGSFIESAQPELIIRFGAMPTSKPLLLYLKRYATTPLVVIDGNSGWEEPTQLASQLIHTNPTAFCNELLNALEQQQTNEKRYQDAFRERDQDSASAPAIPYPTPSPTDGDLARDHRSKEGVTWLSLWKDTDKITQHALEKSMYDFEEIFEGRVFSELANLLPESTTLYIGNSMPVRDLDTFFWSRQQHIHIIGNRGTNGIDGVISTALGASAVGEQEPTVLVLGDLSFFHDLNGLLAARLHQLNLTIILINNDGGGIFSFLPQAAYPEHFEQLFGTPTGLDFQPVVEMYGGRFQRVDGWEAFRKAVNLGLNSDGLDVIEVLAERSSNVNMHRQLWDVVKKAINK
jgi:2-succinyl-5-enolpyruvyl-6-hydroxy-3-cyclohexene-1-carboxylate synthase